MIKDSIKQNNRSPRIPARVILNNKTLTVFESDDYQTIIFSMNLENLKTIENSSEDPENCFILKDCIHENRISLCGFSSGIEKASKQKKEWLKQIYFFRDKCQEDGNKYNDEILLMKKRALDEESLERRVSGRKVRENSEKMERKLEKLQNLAMIVCKKKILEFALFLKKIIYF